MSTRESTRAAHHAATNGGPAGDTPVQDPRANAVRNLVELRIPLTEATAALARSAWDSDAEFVTLTRIDALRPLRRLKDQQLTARDCQRWAEALEGRNDLGFEAGFANTLNDFLFEIGTPNRVGGLTVDLAARWHKPLGDAHITGTTADPAENGRWRSPTAGSNTCKPRPPAAHHEQRSGQLVEGPIEPDTAQ